MTEKTSQTSKQRENEQERLAAQNKNCKIFFKNDGMSISFNKETVPSSIANAIFVEFDEVNYLITARLKGFNRRLYNNQIKKCVLIASMAEEASEVYSAFSLLKQEIEKHPKVISRIQKDNLTLYYLENKNILFSHGDLPEDLMAILNKYNHLASYSRHVLGERKHKENAAFFFSCVAVAVRSRKLDAFDPYIERIDKLWHAKCEAHNGISITIMALIALIIVLLTSTESTLGVLPTLHNIYPFVFGTIGAWLSFMQRGDQKFPSHHSPIYQIYYDAACRVAIGALFGYLTFLFITSGIALSMFAKSNDLMSIAFFLAGFSERLVPDLIGRASNDAST